MALLVSVLGLAVLSVVVLGLVELFGTTAEKFVTNANR